MLKLVNKIILISLKKIIKRVSCCLSLDSMALFFRSFYFVAVIFDSFCFFSLFPFSICLCIINLTHELTLHISEEQYISVLLSSVSEFIGQVEALYLFIFFYVYELWLLFSFSFLTIHWIHPCDVMRVTRDSIGPWSHYFFSLAEIVFNFSLANCRVFTVWAAWKLLTCAWCALFVHTPFAYLVVFLWHEKLVSFSKCSTEESLWLFVCLYCLEKCSKFCACSIHSE